MSPSTRKPHGFAAMDPAYVASIAKRGGIAAHAQGRAHEWTDEEAKLAGAKGGRATQAKLAAQRAAKATEESP